MSKRVFWTLDDAGKLVAVLDSLMDTDDDHEKRLTALEQRGEPKPMVGICHFDSIGRQHDGPILGCPICKPAPTPATVEKFNSYKFDKHGFEGGANFYLKVFVGEVVATPYGGDDERWKWQVKFPGNALVFICYTEEQWRALVTMQLQSGVWERING